MDKCVDLDKICLYFYVSCDNYCKLVELWKGFCRNNGFFFRSEAHTVGVNEFQTFIPSSDIDLVELAEKVKKLTTEIEIVKQKR